MEGNLVIVESPAKAKSIQKFLGKDYVVKASFGHIRDLDEKKLGIDIKHGFKPEYIVPAGKKKVVSELKKAAAEAQNVWLASDEDREGEAISWHLCETLGLDPVKTKRIVFHEITKDALLKAVENPRSIDLNLVNAQQARRVLDRLVGFELSPVLWRKIQPKLSAGRVQSVALRLVVDKEKEIMAFEPKPYYKVEAVFEPSSATGAKVKATLDKRFDNIDDARAFLEDCVGAAFTVSSVEEKQGSRFPAPPFTTSTLQQEAAHKLHLPVSATMKIAQDLYEKGLITYMRTDSTNLSSLALNTAKKYILENYGEDYSHPRQYKTKSVGAQEAHEAIRPTYIENATIPGTPQEQKLYELIWKRTVASQMAEASMMNTSIKVNIDRRDEKFEMRSSRILFEGFLKVYSYVSDSEDDTVILPAIQNGVSLTQKGITAECKFTEAPARYSEGTLVKKLEELGIGRPSTYSPTISTLTNGRGYLAKGNKEGRKVDVLNLALSASGELSSKQKSETVGAEKGKLFPQEIGIIVTDYLVKNFPDILDYTFTAKVEEDFDSVAEGKMQWDNVISQFYSPFHGKVDEALSDRVFAHVSRELGTAPDGDVLVARFGKYGPYVQKGDPEKKQFANLGKGQLIESITLEDALKLFELPRTVGEYMGIPVIATKGRFGPYLKFGSKNVSINKGSDPLKITLEECIALIESDSKKVGVNAVIQDFASSGIQILNGRYGPYIKYNGKNFKLPKGKNPASISEAECKTIVGI